MNRECYGDNHVFWNVMPNTWGAGQVQITVDENGHALCFCGKYTLTNPSTAVPLCDSCSHPNTHHLHGYCYGPVEHDGDCGCRQFVPKPTPILGPRRIVV